jgi:hypothetical protein
MICPDAQTMDHGIADYSVETITTRRCSNLNSNARLPNWHIVTLVPLTGTCGQTTIILNMGYVFSGRDFVCFDLYILY